MNTTELTDSKFHLTVRFENEFPVDLRELHSDLMSRQDFSTWAKSKLSQFVQNEDFRVFHNIVENPTGGRPRLDYHITLDGAKEIAMMENTDRGRQVRRYFIAVEKAFREGHTVQAALPSVPDMVAAKIAGFAVRDAAGADVLRMLVDLHRDITEPTPAPEPVQPVEAPAPTVDEKTMAVARWLVQLATVQAEVGLDERQYTMPELLAKCPPIPANLPNKSVSLGLRLAMLAGLPIPMDAGRKLVIVPTRNRNGSRWLLQVSQVM